MTDTPPYYWLNGEDGPLELEESRPPPDGVLAARPISGQSANGGQNGLLIGIDLSRNADRKRHGYTEETQPTLGVDPSGMPGGGIRPPLGLQVPGLNIAGLSQFGVGNANVPRCNSIPGHPIKSCGPLPNSPFGACRQGAPQLFHGPPLPTPQQTQCYPPPSAPSPNMGTRWPLNGTAGTHGTSVQQAPTAAQQQGQGQAQVPMRSMVCAPPSVQRRPMSPAPATRMQTPPASPGAWTRKVGTSGTQGGNELQNSSSFHRSANNQKANSFISTRSTSAVRSSSFTAAPPDGMVGIAPNPLPSNPSFTATTSSSPMGKGGPMMYPPSPPSTHGSFVAVSPAPKIPTVVPPTRIPVGNSYSPIQSSQPQAPQQAPQVFAPSHSQYPAPVGGTWSAPVPGLAIPRPTTPLMESRGSMSNTRAGTIRRGAQSRPSRHPNACHPVDIHHEIMTQSSGSRPVQYEMTPQYSGSQPATSSTGGQRQQRPPAVQYENTTHYSGSQPATSSTGGQRQQRAPPAQERVRVRRPGIDDTTTQHTAPPIIMNSWVEVRNTPQSPALSSYSFGQTVPTSSETPDCRSPCPVQAHSDEGRTQAVAHAREGAIQVPVCSRELELEPMARKNDPLRILVTGSTGLLGRQVLHALNGYDVRGLYRSRGRKTPLISCDLTAEGEATRQIEEFSPHIVIHLAGERRADVIKRSPARSRLLNVDASGALAAACEFCGAWLIFVSSDAVFDGSSPPYAEDDSPNPVTEYGWHKLHAEKIVLAACPRAAVLRLPLLYGPVEFAAESVVTEIYSELRIGMKELDNHKKCYPTWTCDVAKVIRAMVDMYAIGTEIRGIFHWQDSEQFTKYDIGMIIASACGFPAPHALTRDTLSGGNCPAEDSRLDCSRLQGLLTAAGFPLPFTPLREGLRSCLEVFHDARLDTSGRSCRVEAPIVHPVSATLVDEPVTDKPVQHSQQKSPKFHDTREVHSDLATQELQDHANLQDPIASKLACYRGKHTPDQRGNAPESSSMPESREAFEQREKNEHHRLQSLSLRSEDGHAARAAALKNVFREELELAWRRYRDAAYDENAAETKTFENGEHRGVLV